MSDTTYSPDTTSILDLPSDPAAGGSVGKNIMLHVTETTLPSVTLDQNTISQIVSGIQQASVTGATLLPSRDIPKNTDVDPQIQPNYIPQNPQNNDYIHDHEETSDIIDNYNKKYNNSSSLDELYEELQTPLLLAVLFFLFQLPFFRKLLFRYLPVLFFKDGNHNLYGYVFMSVAFGLLYYILTKMMVQFNRF